MDSRILVSKPATRVSGRRARHTASKLVVCAIFGVVTAACLSKPDAPAVRDGGTESDGGPQSDGGTQSDGGGVPCSTPVPLESANLFNDGFVFGDNPKVGRLNGDCLDDLVMTGADTTGVSFNGVVVVFGRLTDFMAGYDWRYDLTPLIPLELELVDADADGNLDIVVVAHEEGEPRLVVFIGSGDGSFVTPPLIRAPLVGGLDTIDGSVLSHRPAFVQFARSASNQAGFVFGGENDAVVLTPQDFSGGGFSSPLSEYRLPDVKGVSNSVGKVQALHVLPSTSAGTDDLLAIRHSHATIYRSPTGVGTYADIGQSVDLMTDGDRITAEGNLGGGSARDVVVVQGTSIQALSATDLPLSGMSDLVLRSITSPSALAFDFTDLVIAETGTGTSPTLFLLQPGTGACGKNSCLYGLADFALEEPTLTPAEIHSAAFVVPFHHLAIGDFQQDSLGKQIYLFPTQFTTSAAPNCVVLNGTGSTACFAACGQIDCITP